jgi:recombination protein RecA
MSTSVPSQLDDLRAFLANAKGTSSGGGRALATAPVLSLDELKAQHQEQAQDCWSLAAMRGRLVEISARGATAVLTTAIGLVLDAQMAGEPVVWVTLAQSCFFPPDVAACGVDLAALVVLRLPDANAAMRGAERVLRSGAFGLVVIDIGNVDANSAQARRNPERGVQSSATHARLITLAQQYDAAVICLTEKSAEAGSLGSLVSLRAEALRIHKGNDHFAAVRVVKDKRRGPGFTVSRSVKPPAGL